MKVKRVKIGIKSMAKAMDDFVRTASLPLTNLQHDLVVVQESKSEGSRLNIVEFPGPGFLFHSHLLQGALRVILGNWLLEKVRVRSRPLEDDDAGFKFVDEEPVRFDVAFTPPGEFSF